MTMPPWSEDPGGAARPTSASCANWRWRTASTQLSMGMSNDLETAIEEGSTCVRVGTALFGKRRKT